MTDVRIDRFSTRAQVRDEEEAARVRRLVADLSGRELAGALADSGVPDGLWCVRRLDVDVVLDDRTDGDLERAWAHLVVDALLGQLAEADRGGGDTFVAMGPDVVRYVRHEQALLDLVTSVALRRTDRGWAWRALSVLQPGDPDPDLDGRGAVMAALLRRPTAIVPVLAATAAAIGVAPLHRLLGEPGWGTLAAVVARTNGVGKLLLAPADHTGTDPDPHGTDRRVTNDAVDLAGRALGRSLLARAWCVGPVQVDHELGRSIALLAVAAAEPMLLRRHDAAAVLHAAAIALGAAPGRSRSGLVVRPSHAPQPDLVTGTGTDAHQQAHPWGAQRSAETRDVATRSDHGRTAPTRADDAPPTPHRAETALTAQPPAPLGMATVLGGLVHLLATADAAGVPDTLVAEPALRDLLPSVALRSLLVEVADGDEPADPMFAALSGQSMEEPLPVLSVAARATLRRSAANWRRVTWERLDAARPATPAGSVGPHEAVPALLRRLGHVLVEPGWVEVHLRLEDVDLNVRRAGLDLDPGFVPWLGAVVVIRYA